MAERQRSITFTALIFFGMLVALVGLAITLLGIGDSTTFELKVGEVQMKTTTTGLAVLAIGAAISAGCAIKLPEGVQVFGPSSPTLTERLKRLAPAFIGVATIALIGLVVSMVM